MFQRRLVQFSFLLAMAMGILIARLAWLQLIHGREYARKADTLLEGRYEWLDTARGTIYDCRGEILAVDQPVFRVCLHYKLIRLYYEWFWRDQELRYLNTHPDKTPDDAIRHVQQEYGPQRRKADELLIELADIIGVSMDEIHEEIRKLNERIFVLRTSRARRLWYSNNNVPFESQPDTKAIRENFALKVPNDDKRLQLIYRTRVWEMTQPQPILKPIQRIMALTINERFVGSLLGGSLEERPVTVQTGKTRVYPHNGAACHLIGQLGPISDDLTASRQQDPNTQELAAYYSGDRRGWWGIEYIFEKVLRGCRGWVRKHAVADQTVRTEPVFGANITMTLDIRLQKRIRELFEGKNERGENYPGGAVVIDVPTGQVRAAVSVPTFDLNTCWRNPYYKEIFNTSKYLSRALGKPYQSGSTIKTTLLLGALAKNLIDPDKTFFCSLSNKNWPGKPDHIHDHGQTGGRKAIKLSCNYFFIKLGEKYGPDGMTNWLKSCGFNKPVLAQPKDYNRNGEYWLFRETSGHISPQGAEMSDFYLRFVSIGLNPLNTSILQIADTMATIARDGLMVQPSMVQTPSVPQHKKRIASAANAKVVQAGMWAVINEPEGPYGTNGVWERAGTAYNAFYDDSKPLLWDDSRAKVYGKTGTTDNSVFACYVKAADGRCLAVAVIVEVDANGSEVAAPMARDILRICSEQGYLPEIDASVKSTLSP